MTNLKDRLETITILGQEYPMAISNVTYEEGRIQEMIDKGFDKTTWNDIANLVKVLINEGIKLSNFINKEKEPLLTDSEVEILVSYATKQEFAELGRKINTLKTKFETMD